MNYNFECNFFPAQNRRTMCLGGTPHTTASNRKGKAFHFHRALQIVGSDVLVKLWDYLPPKNCVQQTTTSFCNVHIFIKLFVVLYPGNTAPKWTKFYKAYHCAERLNQTVLMIAVLTWQMSYFAVVATYFFSRAVEKHFRFIGKYFAH